MDFKIFNHQLQTAKKYGADFHGFFQKPVKIRLGYLKTLEAIKRSSKLFSFRSSFFKRSLFLRQQIKIFYGGLKSYQLKHRLKAGLQTFFMSHERQLDYFVYRLNFFDSLRTVRKLIKFGCVYINGFKKTTFFYNLRPGDVVSFSNISDILETWFTNFKKTNKNSKRIFLRLFPFQYVEFSPTTGNLLFYCQPQLGDFFFPFYVATNSLSASYPHILFVTNKI